MKLSLIVSKWILAAIISLMNLAVAGHAIQLRHTASEENIIEGGSVTIIDHWSTNDQSEVVVILNPVCHSMPGTMAAGFSAVYYSSIGRWGIRTDAAAGISVGTVFNILTHHYGPNSFVHTVSPENLNEHTTIIDHPLLNGQPDVVAFLTPLGQAETSETIHPLGLFYHNGLQRWGIFNQNAASMIEGMAFNVVIFWENEDVFTHITTGNNISGNASRIDHNSTNRNPNALIISTPVWRANGSGWVQYDQYSGVQYNSEGWWEVAGLDSLTAMPEGAAFNVIVGNSPVGIKGAEPATPSENTLSQNYPNPFNPQTKITFTLIAEGDVRLEVFNILGQRMAILLDEWRSPGEHAVDWYPGENIPGGIYFYRIIANSFTDTGRMILMR